jgi:hypothetical protein
LEGSKHRSPCLFQRICDVGVKEGIGIILEPETKIGSLDTNEQPTFNNQIEAGLDMSDAKIPGRKPKSLMVVLSHDLDVEQFRLPEKQNRRTI